MPIPKILHYVWFSEQVPEQVRLRISVWQRLMPEYKIIRWNRDNFPVSEHLWVREALEHKKFAFATDYVRFYALQKFGGIYLDCDVQVIKPFDDLLELPYFVGMEQTSAIVESAVLGAQPNAFWLADMLAYYKNRHFAKTDGTLDTLPVPRIMLELLGKKYGFARIGGAKEFNSNSAKIQILPPEFFSPQRWDSRFARLVCENTYCIHRFDGSWTSGKKRSLKQKIMSAARYAVGDDKWQRWMFKRAGGKC